MRRVLTLFVLFFFCSISDMRAADSRYKTDLKLTGAEADLRHAFVKSVSHSCGLVPDHPVDFLLMRGDFEKTVAVVRIRKNGTAILNPPGYSYRRMPKLDQLTPIQAAQLWSFNGRDDSSSCDRTYQLKTSKLEVFNIDLHFSNNRLQKYRVRSNHYLQTKQQWFNIHSSK